MAQTALDRNLLFGVVALQMEFVTRDALVAAIKHWVLEAHTPLDEILVERGVLAEDERAMLEPLVGKHLEQHSFDAERSLAALSSVTWIKGGSPRHVAQRETGAGPAELRTDAASASSTVGGRFDIVRLYARGGLGEVFVARDRELGRDVALKQIQPRFADDASRRARFVREAEITGGLEHPGVAPVYALGRDGHGRPYYAMRLIRGDSLKEAIDRFHAAHGLEPAPGERAIGLQKLMRRFLDVCNAIEFAHSRGVLHRDIKPSNIVVGMHGETLVVDWGIAKTMGNTEATGALGEPHFVPSPAADKTETLQGVALGTPSFMSPEQASGALDRIGPASDVYSLGSTLYYLLSGRPPFVGSGVDDVLRAVRRGTFPPPRQVGRFIPRALEAICLKAMALEARDRYTKVQLLADDVERWMADEPVSARPEPMAERIMPGFGGGGRL